jgi:hypothetical protein
MSGHCRHQHHAPGGRDAGAADHLPHHHSGGHALGAGGALPKERNEVRETKPENIVISVDKDGRHLLVRHARCATSMPGRQAQEGGGDEPAARGAYPRRRAFRYEPVGKIVFSCQRAGIMKRSASSPSRPLAAAEKEQPWE